MNFEQNKLYHVYNRTFDKRQAFVTEKNYKFFLEKVAELKSLCDLLAYCLMPTHFHLMIYMPVFSQGLSHIHPSDSSSQLVLARKIGTILSSYTQAFNLQENRKGSLFQPRTKAIELDSEHRLACFHYIHQNPLKANLVSKPEDWPYSSFNQYFQDSAGLCNKELANNLLKLPKSPVEFYSQSISSIDHEFTRER